MVYRQIFKQCLLLFRKRRNWLSGEKFFINHLFDFFICRRTPNPVFKRIKKITIKPSLLLYFFPINFCSRFLCSDWVLLCLGLFSYYFFHGSFVILPEGFFTSPRRRIVFSFPL